MIDQMDLIKSYVFYAPNYNLNIYHWPFLGTVAKFISKEYLSKPFKDIWEVDNETLVYDERLWSPVSVD